MARHLPRKPDGCKAIGHNRFLARNKGDMKLAISGCLAVFGHSAGKKSAKTCEYGEE